MPESIRVKIAHGIYVPERLPRAAEQASAGGLIAAAESICRQCHEAVRSDQAAEYASEESVARRRAGRFAVNKLIRPVEESALGHWASEANLWLPDAIFTEQWLEQGQRGESEQQIYFDEPTQRWFKRNNLIYHGTWLEYFHRLALHNWLFPETAVTFEGIMEYDGQLTPVISQPHIHATRGASRLEVASEIRTLAFEPVPDPARPDDYINWELGVEVTDLHDENVLVNEAGLLFFIDPIPMMEETSKIRRLLNQISD